MMQCDEYCCTSHQASQKLCNSAELRDKFLILWHIANSTNVSRIAELGKMDGLASVNGVGSFTTTTEIGEKDEVIVILSLANCWP